MTLYKTETGGKVLRATMVVIVELSSFDLNSRECMALLLQVVGLTMDTHYRPPACIETCPCVHARDCP